MKKIISAIAFSFLLVSCQEIKGNMEVLKNITLKSQNGSEQIISGAYSGSVNFPSKKRMVLELDQVEGQFTFNIPKNVRIPDNGKIVLTADQVGQPYDVDGLVATNVQRGPIQESWESCTYQRPYTVCRTDARGNRTCWTEYRTEFGRQYVRFFIETVTKDLVFNLVSDSEIQSSFTGKDVARYRRDLYADQCR